MVSVVKTSAAESRCDRRPLDRGQVAAAVVAEDSAPQAVELQVDLDALAVAAQHVEQRVVRREPHARWC